MSVDRGNSLSDLAQLQELQSSACIELGSDRAQGRQSPDRTKLHKNHCGDFWARSHLAHLDHYLVRGH
jgi:hypothetical protein